MRKKRKTTKKISLNTLMVVLVVLASGLTFYLVRAADQLVKLSEVRAAAEVEYNRPLPVVTGASCGT